MRGEQLAYGLGWFSIGLGLAELLAPRRMEAVTGVSGPRALMPSLGARELANGLAILKQPRNPAWVWTRVAGDVMDLSTLGASYCSRPLERKRILGSAAAVLGVTVLDVLCAQQLSAEADSPLGRTEVEEPVRVVKTISINRSAADIYDFLKESSNLPQIVEHLESVNMTSPSMARWTIAGPLGRQSCEVEEVKDREDEQITWHMSKGSADYTYEVTFTFEETINNRGTVVRLEVERGPGQGALAAKTAKLVGHSPEQQLPAALRRLKQLMETGEISTVEGQPAGRSKSISKRFDRLAPNWAEA